MTGGGAGCTVAMGVDKDVVRQAVVPFLEAPCLKGITTKDFVRFKKKRELYEDKLAEKNRVENTDTPATSYKASIDKLLLKNFLIARWILADSVDDITEEALRKCVDDRAKIADEDTSLRSVNKVVNDVRMNMSLKNTEDRIWDLMNRYTATLENAGIYDLPESRPHVAIKHILERVKPFDLRKRMKEEIQWQKSDGRLKTDFGEFMRELVKRGKRLDNEKRGLSGGNLSESDSDFAIDSDTEDEERHSKKRREKSKRKFRRSKSASRKRSHNDSDSTRESDGSSKKKARKHPLKCLNPDCEESHFVKYCSKTTPQQKKVLLEAHRAKLNKQRARKDDSGSPARNLMHLDLSQSERSVSLFTATFASGNVQAVVLIDQGATHNILPQRLLQLIVRADSHTKVSELASEEAYSTAAKDGPKIHVRHKAQTDVELRVRHGARLLIRGVEWKVSEEDMSYVVIGNELLKAMGIDNDVLIQAVMDRNDGVVDEPRGP